jgi:hypothetical protein
MTLGMTISKTHMRSGVLNVGTSQKPHRVVTRTAMLAALQHHIAWCMSWARAATQSPGGRPGSGARPDGALRGDAGRARARRCVESLHKNLSPSWTRQC